MNERIARLLELQEVDKQLASLTAERDAKPRLLRARRETLAAHEARMDALTAEIKHLQSQAKQRELEVQAQEEKIARLRVQLNAIKNNKEYRTMLHEIEAAQASLSDAEDGVLGTYEAIETAQEEQAHLNEVIAQSRDDLEGLAREVDETRAELDRNIEIASAKRAEISRAVESEDLNAYQRLNYGHPGQAVVPVIGGSCRGCFTGLTSNQQASLLSDEKAVLCASCGRIVYLGDDLSAAEMNEPRRYNPLS